MNEKHTYHTTSTRISASAGTGKTYRLASRYISLLMLNVDPEKIIALTFTKKAAGEFRSRILHALAKGACNVCDKKTGRNELTARVWETWSGLKQNADMSLSDEESVPLLPITRAVVRRAAALQMYPENLYAEDKELQEFLKLREANAATFAELLQTMVSSLSKLTLSTLDSYFNTLVTGSSLELGVNTITALDPAEEPKARRRAVEDYLETGAENEEKRTRFLRIFADLTGGKGSRTISNLEKEIKHYLELYYAFPHVESWQSVAYFAQACTTDDFCVLTPKEAEEWTQQAAELGACLRGMSKKDFPQHVYGGLLKLTQQEKELSATLEKWCRAAMLYSKVPEQLKALARLKTAFEMKEPWTDELETCGESVATLLQTMSAKANPQKGFVEVCKRIQSGTYNDVKETRALWSFYDDMMQVNPDSLMQLQKVHDAAQNLHHTLSAKVLADTAARTRSLYSLLRDYAVAYDRRMTETGQFSFSDISRKAHQLMQVQPQEEDIPHGDFCREHLALRTGRQYRHWLLDEFQDTSDGQFDTLSPVLESIAEDAYQGEMTFSADSLRAVPESLRPFMEAETYCVAEGSLFVVGDDKQGIYGFRTGKTQAFTQLGCDEPWRSPVVSEDLLKSFRSSPVIMGKDGFVNELFRNLNEVETADAGDRAVDLRPFTKHATAKDFAGYVKLMLAEEADSGKEQGEPDALNQDDAADGEDSDYQQIADILKTLTEDGRTPKNGMSIAILTRSNEQAGNIADALQTLMPELPVLLVKESLSAVASPLGVILHHFFRWLLHPTEGFSLGVLRASFLRSLFCEGVSEERTWLLCCRELEEKGYTGMLRKLIELLPPAEKTAHRLLLNTWMEAARDFDAAGGSPEQWVRRIATLSSKGVSSSSYVQVMTMHQSKGLEFDAVILPLTAKKAIDDQKSLTCFVSPGGGSILLSPAKASIRNSWWPGAFSSLTDDWQQNSSREAYNLLYVAATRAKYANYILLHRAELKTTKGTPAPAARSEAGLIRRAFDVDAAGCVERGNAEWYNHMEQEPEEKVRYAAGEKQELGESVARRRRVSPSSMAAEPIAASSTDKEKKYISYTLESAEFGTRVHALFEQLEWVPEGAPLPFAAQDGAAAAEVCAALQVPEVAALFRPQTGLAVYNEQPMDAVLTKDGEEVWVSAIIDRLVLERTLTTEKTEQGTIIEHEEVTAAHIIDYKTNKRDPKLSPAQQDEALRKEYRGQMTAYRELIAAAVGLPESKVTVTLVSVPRDGTKEGEKARLVPMPF